MADDSQSSGRAAALEPSGAAAPVADASRMADEPRTPRRIALVQALPDAGLEFLLDDFRAAYAAYSRLAGCELPKFDTLGPRAGASIEARAVAKAHDAALVCGSAAKSDGIVYACTGTADAEDINGLARLMGPDTRLHVIFDLPGLDPARADETARELYELCGQCDALWGGGVVFAGGRPFDVLDASPRMGLSRRPFSEAMDMLVGAARMGCSVRRSQELGGADVSDFDALSLVRAAPALPPVLWNLVMSVLRWKNHTRSSATF